MLMSRLIFNKGGDFYQWNNIPPRGEGLLHRHLRLIFICISIAIKEVHVISPVHRMRLDKDQERSFAMIFSKSHFGL